MSNSSSWSNGNTGLGIRIDASFVNTIFNNNFKTIDLYHNGNLVSQQINVSNKNCKELINVDIGRWLVQNNFHQWKKQHPHRFTITQRNNNIFDII